MKNLFSINEDEKNRILNLHETATKRQYLSEESIDVIDGAKKINDIVNNVGNANITNRIKYANDVVNIIKQYNDINSFENLMSKYKETYKKDFGVDLFNIIQSTTSEHSEAINQLKNSLDKIGYTMNDRTLGWGNTGNKYPRIWVFRRKYIPLTTFGQSNRNQPQNLKPWSMVPPQQNSGSASTDTNSSQLTRTKTNKQRIPQPSDFDLDNYLNQQ